MIVSFIDNVQLVLNIHVVSGEVQPLNHSISNDVDAPLQLQTGSCFLVENTDQGFLHLRLKISEEQQELFFDEGNGQCN